MFDAPEIITNIPDIAAIYAKNEEQENALDDAAAQCEDDLFLEDMGADHIKRWETILGISPAPDDSLDYRRYRVTSKLMEKLPYTRQTLRQKLDALCPNGYHLTYKNEPLGTEMYLYLALDSEKKKPDVQDLLERTLPLDVYYEIILSAVREVYGTAYMMCAAYTEKKIAPAIRE